MCKLHDIIFPSVCLRMRKYHVIEIIFFRSFDILFGNQISVVFASINVNNLFQSVFFFFLFLAEAATGDIIKELPVLQMNRLLQQGKNIPI